MEGFAVNENINSISIKVVNRHINEDLITRIDRPFHAVTAYGNDLYIILRPAIEQSPGMLSRILNGPYPLNELVVNHNPWTGTSLNV